MDLLRKDEKPDIHTREYVTTNQYTEMNNLNNLKMLSLLLSACFATASCVSDKVEMGPTIDEIDIIERTILMIRLKSDMKNVLGWPK